MLHPLLCHVAGKSGKRCKIWIYVAYYFSITVEQWVEVLQNGNKTDSFVNSKAILGSKLDNACSSLFFYTQPNHIALWRQSRRIKLIVSLRVNRYDIVCGTQVILDLKIVYSDLILIITLTVEIASDRFNSLVSTFIFIIFSHCISYTSVLLLLS